MASSAVTLCNRTSGKSSRIRLEDINLNMTVDEFRSISSSKIDLQPHQFELVYCGRRLQDNQTLEYYGIHGGVTIHALRSPPPPNDELPEKLDEEGILQVTTALQAALINPAFRHTIEKMLNDPEAVENIVAATPGLDKDPVAIGILRSPELLAALADPSIVNKVIEAHPTLGHAATLVAAAVNEEGTKAGTTGMSGRGVGSYSLDQMSDDEDMENVAAPRPGAQGITITTSQLAAALAATGGAGPPILPSGEQGSSGESAPPSAITTDFFQQAMMQAASGALSHQQSESASSTPSDQPVVTQAQLQQLQDMGITDEGVARRALEATGGNIQAALELIFGDGI